MRTLPKQIKKEIKDQIKKPSNFSVGTIVQQ